VAKYACCRGYGAAWRLVLYNTRLVCHLDTAGALKVLEQIRPSDELYIAAYPHFNVGEIIAIAELWEGTKKPIVVFNGAHADDRCHLRCKLRMPLARRAGQQHAVTFLCAGELDRVRSGYYPSLFYPKVTTAAVFGHCIISHNVAGPMHLAWSAEGDVVPSQIGKLAKSFIPSFEAAYYIHNFKGARGGERCRGSLGCKHCRNTACESQTVTITWHCPAGVLFRCYPGPWQVMRRYAEDDMRVVHTQDTMPTLKQVAIDILPNA
jgi:Domain of unknown function (DUF1995)